MVVQVLKPTALVLEVCLEIRVVIGYLVLFNMLVPQLVLSQNLRMQISNVRPKAATSGFITGPIVQIF